ncbi:tyrosine recombinase [Bacteroidia bacterium]|nr:tyrosine recombinase [Bacteroidia bacterium]
MNAKKTKKANDPITLRERTLKNGGTSFYLDYYVSGQRRREFLKIPLAKHKENYKAAKQMANDTRIQRLNELLKNEYKLPDKKTKNKKTLCEYINELALKKRGKTNQDRGNYQSYKALEHNIIKYNGDKLLSEIDPEYCENFIARLRAEGLSPNTIYGYTERLNYVLKKAAKGDEIRKNPFDTIDDEDLPKKQKAVVNYLTKEEVDMLIATPCTCNNVKLAFLFSCFTGLRKSDVRSLTLNDIQNDPNGNQVISKRIKKTDNWEYLPLEKEAKEIIEKQTPATGNIFPLKSDVHTGTVLKQWVLSAGITKKVTFHVSRHTSATLALSTGAALTTIQKNLGHVDYSSTLIYAAVLPKVQREAARDLGKLFEGKIANMP